MALFPKEKKKGVWVGRGAGEMGGSVIKRTTGVQFTATIW